MPSPREPTPVPLRDLFAAVGPWSRRELRRMQGGVRGAQGTTHALDDRVPLDQEWRPFAFRDVSLEARLTLPPLLLMDKPVGVVTSRVREGGAATVFDVLDEHLPLDPAPERVEPVGRLDRDTSGLLLFTGDGRLIQRLTHPKREVPRSYEVEVEGDPDAQVMAGFREGAVALRDGHCPHPRELEPLGGGRWGVTLVEGKYHEVRRMFAAAGAHVTGLRRVAHAGFTLDSLGGRPVLRLPDPELRRFYEELGLSVPALEPEVREVPPHGDSGSLRGGPGSGSPPAPGTDASSEG
jgi:16S rRNA pseudouridine516 synthase